MGMTFKSSKGVHIVTENGKPKVFTTLIEAIKHIFGEKRNESS